MHLDSTAPSALNADSTLDSRFQLHESNAASPIGSARAGDQYYVALSRFTVDQMTDQVKQAFQHRPHRVDNATGFVRMDVLSPFDAPNEIWLITYWKDESSYKTWHRSHLYQESHQGIPKGLRLVPKSVSIRFFEHVAS